MITFIHSLHVIHTWAKRTYRCRFCPSNLEVLGTKLGSSGFTLSSWCLQLPTHFARPLPCFKVFGYTVWSVNSQNSPACPPSSRIPGMCCHAGFFTVGSEDPDLHPHPLIACISTHLITQEANFPAHVVTVRLLHMYITKIIPVLRDPGPLGLQ